MHVQPTFIYEEIILFLQFYSFFLGSNFMLHCKYWSKDSSWINHWWTDDLHLTDTDVASNFEKEIRE